MEDKAKEVTSQKDKGMVAAKRDEAMEVPMKKRRIYRFKESLLT